MQDYIAEVQDEAGKALQEVDALKFELNNRENDILIIKEDMQN